MPLIPIPPIPTKWIWYFLRNIGIQVSSLHSQLE
jgi:hypothetical protein